MGPFQIKVSKNAELKDIQTLTEEEKKVLTRDHKYKSDSHDIYQILISPVFDMKNRYKSRIRKKKSFSKVDRCYVNIEFGDEGIQLLGIFPTTTTIAGQTTFDFEGEFLFEIGVPKITKLQIKGKLKNKIRRDTHSIFATRVPPAAQWAFLKPYIDKNSEFHTKVLCSVPKSLESKKRYVICDVDFRSKGRIIEKSYKNRVFMII